MDETAWIESVDPHAMLAFLQERGLATPRKLRLFSCACCRRIWRLLQNEGSRRAVATAEQFADGKLFAIDDVRRKAWDVVELYYERFGSWGHALAWAAGAAQVAVASDLTVVARTSDYAATAAKLDSQVADDGRERARN